MSNVRTYVVPKTRRVWAASLHNFAVDSKEGGALPQVQPLDHMARWRQDHWADQPSHFSALLGKLL